MATKCAATTRAGKPCHTAAVAGSAYCWTHDPALTEERRLAGVKGGRARSNKARALKAIPDPMTAEQAAGWVSRLLVDVVEGRAEPRVAVAAATLAKTLVDLRKAAARERIYDYPGYDEPDDDEPDEGDGELPESLQALSLEEFVEVIGQAKQRVAARQDAGQAAPAPGA